VLTAALAVGLFMYFFPKERIKEIAIEQARKTINRELTIGDIHYSLRGVVLDNIEILNSDDIAMSEDDKIFAKADSIFLRFSLLDLLEKKIKLSYIYLDSFRFNILFNEAGESNLQKLIAELTGKKGDSALSASISHIKLHNARLTLKKAPDILKPLEGDYGFNGKVQFGREGEIAISDCELNLPENRGRMYPELLVHTGPGGFKITGDVELKKTSLLWVYRWGTRPQPYDLITGTVRDLIITSEAVEGYVKASSTLTNSKHLLYADGFCRVSIKNRTVLIANTRGKINNSTLWFNYLQFGFDGSNVKFDANNIDAQVVDVIPLVNVIPARLYGGMQGELAYAAGVFNARAKVTSLGYDYGSKTISGVNTELTIVNNQFKQSDISVMVFGQACTASIASTDPKLNRVFINIDTERFVFPEKDESEFKNLDLAFPLRVTGRARAKEFIFKEYVLAGADVHYELAGGRLTLNSLSTSFMEGTIRGRGSIDTTMRPPEVALSLAVENIRLQRFFAQSKQFGNRIFGAISGKADIALTLKENTLDTLRGKTEFTIDKGKLTNTGIQNGLGVWLSELKYKLMDLEFNKIYGNIDINGTRYLVNSFIFNSQNIRFNVRGTFNRDLMAEPLHITLEFSKYFIQDIARPLVFASGYNQYLKGDWYYIPFEVTGNFTDSKNIKKVN
jgi:hypothetical protein